MNEAILLVDFDNTLYVVGEVQKEVSVLYLGEDRIDDTQGLTFFLDRALVDNRRQKVDLLCQSSKTQEALPNMKDVGLAIVTAVSGPAISAK